jgi:hypothetical protein
MAVLTCGGIGLARAGGVAVPDVIPRPDPGKVRRGVVVAVGPDRRDRRSWRNCYPGVTILAIVLAMPTRRRKTSFEIDFEKLDRARNLLGTTTITETVDAALDEVLALERRRELVDLLFVEDVLDLEDAEIMSGAWR